MPCAQLMSIQTLECAQMLEPMTDAILAVRHLQLRYRTSTAQQKEDRKRKETKGTGGIVIAFCCWSCSAEPPAHHICGLHLACLIVGP